LSSSEEVNPSIIAGIIHVLVSTVVNEGGRQLAAAVVAAAVTAVAAAVAVGDGCQC
jgi:hypothetical protein